ICGLRVQSRNYGELSPGSKQPLLRRWGRFEYCRLLHAAVLILEPPWSEIRIAWPVQALPAKRALHASRMALVAVAPTRSTPMARTARSRSKVFTPPAAFTLTCGGEHRRIRRKSSSRAPEEP